MDRSADPLTRYAAAVSNPLAAPGADRERPELAGYPIAWLIDPGRTCGETAARWVAADVHEARIMIMTVCQIIDARLADTRPPLSGAPRVYPLHLLLAPHLPFRPDVPRIDRLSDDILGPHAHDMLQRIHDLGPYAGVRLETLAEASGPHAHDMLQRLRDLGSYAQKTLAETSDP